jgi:hypothetical protein
MSRSSPKSTPWWRQKPPSSDEMTASGSVGAIRVSRHPGAFDARAGRPAPQHQGRDRIDEAIERRDDVGQQDQDDQNNDDGAQDSAH